MHEYFKICIYVFLFTALAFAGNIHMQQDVNDDLTGSSTEDKLLQRGDELIQLTSQAQLKFGKWFSKRETH